MGNMRKSKSGSVIDRGKRALVASSILAGAAVSSTVLFLLTPGLGLIPGLFALGLGALGIGSTVFVAKEQPAVEQRSNLTPLAVGTGISRDVQLKIEELHGLAQIYERRSSTLFPAVNGVLSNVQELFGRMSSRLDEQSARLAAVRYAATLTKLNEALGKRYYLDIEANPELWSNPEQRMEAVEKALNATGEQIIRNIRQLNGSKDLIYQMSLDSLLSINSDEINRRELGIG